MKDAYYFSHDANARNDNKILAMRDKYGMEGYGRYWVLVEILREQSGYKIELSKYVWNALAMQMQCKSDVLQEFIETCINEYELFESDGIFMWSNSLIRRMEKKDEKTELAKKAAHARWGEKGVKNAESMHPHNRSNAYKKKEEESKGNKGEEKGNGVPPPPSQMQMMSDYERDIIAQFHKINHYPRDEQKDIEFIRALQEEYPTVELLIQARNWQIYKIDKPLIPGKSNPRSQFRTWVQKEAKWLAERQPPQEQSNNATPPYLARWEPPDGQEAGA